MRMPLKHGAPPDAFLSVEIILIAFSSTVRPRRTSLYHSPPGLSASTIARLKEVWQGELEHWQRRNLSAKRLCLLLGRRRLLLTTARP